MKKLKIVNNAPSWYEEGLNFECTGCGGCCTGSPGYVWVTEKDIQEMSNYLNLSSQDFSKRYLRRAHNRLCLVEMRKNYDCVFLKEKRCTIYPVRPMQCRTFPWWPQHLTSSEAWEEAGRSCEGINKKAPIVSKQIIEEQKKIQEEHYSQDKKS